MVGQGHFVRTPTRVYIPATLRPPVVMEMQTIPVHVRQKNQPAPTCQIVYRIDQTIVRN